MKTRRSAEIGVFIPVGNNGWVTSTNGPKLPGTYEYNRQVTVLAEQMEFDFALSMAKWRGYGGLTQHWNITLESLTTMAGLAEATTRIGIWGTVHMMIFPPAVVAKMVATLDQISNGWVGLNLVSGSNPHDLGQMGLWRDLDHAERYALAEEWIKGVKRLWTEDRVNHKGEFFELTDCMSYPKPKIMPPVICAGASDRGVQFTIDNCNGSFFPAGEDDAAIARGKRAKELDVKAGKPDFKTYGLFSLIPGATDAEAADRLSSSMPARTVMHWQPRRRSMPPIKVPSRISRPGSSLTRTNALVRSKAALRLDRLKRWLGKLRGWPPKVSWTV